MTNRGATPPEPTATALETSQRIFRHPVYQRSNARRLEHLATLGLDLNSKSVLEIGGGVGDHTTFFLDRGCNVVSTEPRPENCANFVKAMHQYTGRGGAGPTRWRLHQCDVESLDTASPQTFDVVYFYGVLYHLGDPAAALAIVARRCAGLLLLETKVSFGDHEAINPGRENQPAASEAFHGNACRPTRPWIFNRLREHFAHVYVPRTQPAHEEFPLDWSVTPAPNQQARAIFIASRARLENPLLLGELPVRQTLA